MRASLDSLKRLSTVEVFLFGMLPWNMQKPHYLVLQWLYYMFQTTREELLGSSFFQADGTKMFFESFF